MKKFYAFAAATLMAVAANAQTLYICGAGDGLAWDPSSPAEMPVVDGNFVMEVTNLTQFKLSTVAGSWDDFNGGALGCNYGEVPGVTVELEEGNDNNIEAPWKGDYTITVSGDMKTITLTTETPNPGPQLPELYLRGDMNSWGAPEEWKFETLSMTTFKFVCGEDQSIKVGEGFKVADADWNKYNFGAGDDPTILLDMDNEIFAGGSSGNLALEEEFNGVVYFVIDLNGEGSNYLFLSNDKDAKPEWVENNAVATVGVDNAAPVYYTLQGVKVANPANGIYVVVKGGKASKTVIK